MITKLDQALRFHETALSLRAQRQQLLASNIANADTPNYKARDIDFSGALKQALSQGGATPGAMTTTTAAHLQGQGANGTAAGVPLLYRSPRQDSVDGNTVDMDAERNQFIDNAVRYEAGLTMVSAEIKKMLSAIQGQ
ncbi:flagellar basal body rod protein FlgB [Noviherbaspirillum massiliense]|uniref:flagellar basal body rod protein FlgB n=1 Tax=Noviherbaspirillum massiliense TaxID=1465823 RepID=UPI000304D767|nr:flagellar basal body rod protein FlgB [Noviherbaspirillum massiliense]